MRSIHVFAVTAIAFLRCFNAQLEAQESPSRRQLNAVAVDNAPELDGKLDDAVWSSAEPTSDFQQREPVAFSPASERTEVRVLYTDDTLFIGITAFDSQPDAIIAKEMGRDAALRRDDSFIVILDTFFDRRNAYFFETNPNGSRTDGLITDEGRDFNIDWDGVWRAEAKIGDFGWSAEMAIPFNTLRFDPRSDRWSINFRRLIRHKNEEVFWSPIGQDADLFRISLAGELLGVGARSNDKSSGLHLDIKPFITATETTSESDDSLDGSDFDGGVDLKWGVTRNLSLDLTVNTDFAETEVDNQQVNLTRFSLFFPEKREFFLENSGIFQFGPSFGRGAPLLQLFFSRRIGITEEGNPAQIDWGARLAGRVGKYSIGLLDAQTQGFENEDETVPENNWGVFRLKRNFGTRSNAGILVTNREGDDGSYNRVFGTDLEFKPTDQLSSWAFGAVSEDPGPTDDNWTAGAGVDYTGRIWDWRLNAVQIAEEFNPEAGFLLRDGTRRYNTGIEYSPRPDWQAVRTLNFEVSGSVFTFTDNSVESVDSRIELFGMTLESGDFFTLFSQFKQENLVESFEIFDDVVIPVDDYQWWDGGIFYRTADSRPLSLSGSLVKGDFFDGKRFASRTTLTWRPSARFRTTTSWRHSDIELPGGEFETNVVNQRLEFSFTPDLALRGIAQYNDVDELVGVNLRLNWIYRPGADLFVVFNQTWDAPNGLSDLSTEDRQLIVKFTYLLQL